MSKPLASLRKRRTCLMCGKSFPSQSPANRRCGRCESDLEDSGISTGSIERMSVSRPWLQQKSERIKDDTKYESGNQ